MPIFDLESLLTIIETYIKANLNDKITKINAEKASLGFSPNLDAPLIKDDAFFLTLDDRVSNFNPYIYYGIGPSSVDAIRGKAAKRPVVFMYVIHNAISGDDAYKRMLRYIRALEEVMDDMSGETELCDLELSTLTPADIQDLDTSAFHKVAGVEVTTTIA